VREAAQALSVLYAAWAAGLCAAQPIKLPDFREELRTQDALCNNCATVRSVRELATGSGRPPPNALTTPPIGTPHRDVLVGPVYYHPLSETSEGFVGGAGTPEMRARFAGTSYEITLHMDDGSYRRVERRDGGRFKPGDRVRVVEGSLQPF
jgi:hypothetical protein